MNYERLTNEELSYCKYPNLIAEIIESGYGMHNIAEFMRLETSFDLVDTVKAKLRGDEIICMDEALRLAKCFGVKVDYLFSRQLTLLYGKSLAHWRWLEINKSKEEEAERIRTLTQISDELNSKPYLIDFIKWCASISENDRKKVLNALNERQKTCESITE